MILIDFIFQQGHFVSMSLLNLNVDNFQRFSLQFIKIGHFTKVLLLYKLIIV